MEPTDNFSQKKKKDLVAIATLFGILSEEKANRMTKPELIEFLAEQDRLSKEAERTTPQKKEISTDDALLRATELLLETIEDSNAAMQMDVYTTAAKTARKVPAAKPVKKNVASAAEVPVAEEKSIPAVESVLAAVPKVTKKPESPAKPMSSSKPESLGKTDSEKTPIPAKKLTPAAIPVPVSEVTPAIDADNEVSLPETPKSEAVPAELAESTESAELNIVKKRGRPKKSSETVFSAESESTLNETSSLEEVVSETISADASIDQERPLHAHAGRKAKVPAKTSESERILEKLPDQSQVSDQSQVPGQSQVPAAPKASESEETTVPQTAQKPQTAGAAPHVGRTKRHSVIIKPKDEDFSDERSSSDDKGESDDFGESGDSRDSRDSRESGHSDRSKTDDSTNPDAPSGEHFEFSPHHARTLRPKEQQQEMLSGVLELMSEGYGFLRRENYLQGQNDIYVPAQYVRRFGLRVGDFVVGPCRPKRDSDRYQALQYIKEVNGLPPEKMIRRVHFDRLTPIYPDEKYVLETDKNELSTRIIDLVAPIGKGQRGMIVSPPKAGKTILLQKIANAISINNPNSKLIVLLIDERPEEVTDMQRSINGEVVYSTFDKTPENHVRIVELVLERAERLVELGQDVIILLDSITRLARAYNLTINPTGRTLSGGLDPGALYGPKRFFGAARNIEGGGSLTIVATSLIDTGSRMDEVIFEEFKGTGNMEVYLDRKLSEKRIFPAIDINKSGTRHEELLLPPIELDAVWTIRKAFGQLDTSAVTEMIISLLMKTATNNQFVQSVNVSFNDKATFDAMRGTRPAGNSTNSESRSMNNGNGK